MTDDERIQFKHKYKPAALSPIKPTTDFDFELLEDVDESEKEHARQQVLIFVEEVMKWLVEDMEREHECTLDYRVYAMAWAMRSPVFNGKTLLQAAEEKGLNRVVFHRHVASFVQRFRTKPQRDKKQ